MMKTRNRIFALAIAASIGASIVANGGQYVLERRGWAGAKHVDNIYDFSIRENSSKSTMTIWIAGAQGMDSYGSIEIIDPEGKKHAAYSWTAERLEKVTKDTKSTPFKGANPVTIDISNDIKKVGQYKVVFTYKKGRHALIIEKVQIDTE
jgi:hypothetical protein